MTANADDTALPLPRSVLFLCNENAVRGPIAEALLARHARGRLYVDSVGLRRTEAPDPFCAAVLAELGIDIAGYGPKAIEDLAETGFDLVIALTRRAYEKARAPDFALGARVEFWPTMNPSLREGNRNAVLSAYRLVRDELMARIAQRFDFSAGAGG